ncbi:MAG: glycosyltransferase family 1 protein [Sphingobacteriales bacterium]|nr:MAG: glycosyltransferase family 1 protein [Sphingobacteriales bacterium]TAF82306.1 MAG: glycosyltransferase family 1 protein [Sphingobacteriales bacterium]
MNTFLVYYDFKNTMGNHAGMAYLANFLKLNVTNLKLIKNPNQEFKFGGFLSKIYAIYLGIYLALKVKKHDKIFFFEYLTKDIAYQDLTLFILRKLNIKNQIYVLVHLSGNNLLELYGYKSTIKEKLLLADKIFTLGSSLTKFIDELDIKKDVVTTFHYVDTNFYKPSDFKIEPSNKFTLKVICMGSLKRNFDDLKKVIEKCKHIEFHLCLGRMNKKTLLGNLNNVKKYDYLSEIELLKLMQSCNCSLSILHDTVGSNVITSSFSTGLVQIVSDVGSIRDYCTTKDSFLCNTITDYVAALNTLASNKEILNSMRGYSIKRAENLSKEKFLNEFKSFIQ